MKRTNILAVVVLVIAANIAISAAVSVDRLLASQVNAVPLSLTPVIITFNHKPASADFAMLQSLGITGGRYLSQLPIVLTKVNLAQLNALKSKPGVVSLYGACDATAQIHGLLKRLELTRHQAKRFHDVAF